MGSRKNKRQNFQHCPVCAESSALIKPLNAAQSEYMSAISNNIVTFGVGPAGTGKTMVAACLAAEALVENKADKIIISRPVVDAGNSLGFLPGMLQEKYEPYIAPVYAVLQDKLGKSRLDYMIKHGQIKPIPLELMRGHSFNDSWVILDEAQNATPAQMKMILTRIGARCRVVINGDVGQCDLRGKSGLSEAIQVLKDVPNVKIVRFESEDIVRSGIVRDVLVAYSKAGLSA